MYPGISLKSMENALVASNINKKNLVYSNYKVLIKNDNRKDSKKHDDYPFNHHAFLNYDISNSL